MKKIPDERVVWDSCVIIDTIQKTQGRYERIEPFIIDAEKGKLLIVISEISVAEVSHSNQLISQGVSLADQAQAIKEWLENPYIYRVPVHAGISELASDIGRQFNLKRAADRIIVATAKFERIPTVHTFDGTDPKKKNKILPLDGKIFFLNSKPGDLPIRIMEPDPAKGTVFEKHLNDNQQTKD